MWFNRAIGEIEDGVRMPIVIAPGQRLYPTIFFEYFSDAPTFDVCSLELDILPSEMQEFTDALGNLLETAKNAIHKEEEIKARITTA